MRGRDAVVPVAHIPRADRIDPAAAEGAQYPTLDRARIVLLSRWLPALRAVSQERARELSHRRCRRVVCFRIEAQRTRRGPCILYRQRIERAKRPLDGGTVAAQMHDPRLASVRTHLQSESRYRAVPQHRLASVRRTERKRAPHGDLRFLRHVPTPSVRFRCGRCALDASLRGNTQDTPGNRFGFGGSKGRTRRAQTSHGLQAEPLFPFGFQRIVDAGMNCCLSTP